MRTPHASGHIFLNTSIKPEAAKGDAIFADVAKRVVAVRLAGISGIEIDDIVSMGFGNTSINSIDQIAVRINQCEAFAALKILERHSL